LSSDAALELVRRDREFADPGHEVPWDDGAGLAEYADAVVDAIGDAKDLVLVAQSFSGFTAPLVCERVPVDLMVLVAAMIPVPGEGRPATGRTLNGRRRSSKLTISRE
jgi:hypothetical protein